MTFNQGGDQYDPDEIVDYEDYGADNNDPSAAVFSETKASGKKGAKNKNDKSQKDKKATMPIVTTYEAYTFTVVDKLTPGQTAPWIRTRRKQLPFGSKEIYDKAMADQKGIHTSSVAQFSKLGPNQQSIVARLIDDKNDDEKDSNAMWSFFGAKKLYEEQKPNWHTKLMVNNAIRVTIKRHDRAENTVLDKNRAQGAALSPEIDDIFDLNKPRKVKKEAETKEGKAGKKKKKAAVADDNFQGWNNVPQNNPDPFAQPQDQYPQQDPFEQQQQQQQQQQFQPQDHYPQQQYPQQQDPFDPFNMQNMQGAMPHDQRDMNVPPTAPMAPPHGHQHPQNAFQPHPDVYPQPDPHGFDPYDDSQPQEFSTRARQPSARRGEDDHHRQRSRSYDARDRSLSRHRRRESTDSERMRRMEEKIDAKLERNSEKITERLDNLRLDNLMAMAVSKQKVGNWPQGGSGYPSSSTASRDGASSHSSSGRGYSTDATSPERFDYRRSKGSLGRRQAYSRNTRPHHSVKGRRDYPEENYILEPAVTYRHIRDRDRDYDYRGEGEWDDYPPQLQHERGFRAQPRVMNHPESRRPAYFKRGYSEGTDFLRDERRSNMFSNDEPRRRHGDAYFRGERAFRD
ncbi:hypothetical protein Q7P37_001610 [Cladosporium fusiforme]